MELKEFIKQSLVDITTGVDEAAKETNKPMAVVSSGDNRTVEFDIAVTVEGRSGSQAGAGIKVLELVNIGGKISSDSANTNVSRVRFGVSIKDRHVKK